MTEAAKAGNPSGAVTSDIDGASPFADPKTRPEASAVDEGPLRGPARLGDQAQMRIGNSLRSLYDSIVQQPMPDRFRDLIDRLDSKEPKTP